MDPVSTRNKNAHFFEIRSALQKMVRRCKIDEGLYYSADLDLMGRGNAVFTSCLLLFVSEDISLADPSVAYFLVCLYQLWLKILKKEDIKNSKSFTNFSARYILQTASYIALICKKSRIVNNASVFVLVLDYKTSTNIDKMFKYLEDAIIAKDEWKVLFYIDFIYRHSNVNSTEYKQDKIDGKEYYKNPTKVFKDMWKIFDRNTKNDKIKNKVVNSLYECFRYNKKIKLHPLFAGLICIKDDLNFREKYYVDFDKILEATKKSYSMNEDFPEFPDYVFDKHTSKGKRMGRGLEHFFDVSSLVDNCGYPDYYYRAAKLIYTSLDKELDTKVKSKNLRPLLRSGEFKLSDELKEKAKKLVLEDMNNEKLEFPCVKKVKGVSIKSKYIKKKDKEYPHNLEFKYTEITPKEKKIFENKDYIIGQKQTAKWKGLTYITKDWVYKGPYTIEQPVLPIIYERVKRFKKLCDNSFIESNIIGDGKIFYIKSKNIGNLPEWKLTWYKAGEKNLPKNEQTLAKVAIRPKKRRKGDVVRAQEEFKEKGKLPDKEWEGLLYHFVVRYVLRVADTGLWNVINGKGIDYEEERTQKKINHLFDTFFAKKPSKDLEIELDRVVKLFKNNLIKKINECMIPELQANGSKLELERGKEILKLLEKYK